MLEVRIISGCRRTYRRGQGLPERAIPRYVEQTLASISRSDIPMNMVTVYVDSLRANFPATPERGGLKVEKAVYRGRPGREIDLTAKVSALLQDSSVLLIASNSFAEGDPDFGVRKTLAVEYSVAGHVRTMEIPEGEVQLLSASRNNLDDGYVECLQRCAKNYKVPVIISTGGGLNVHLPEVFRHPPREDYLLILEDDVTVDPQIFGKTLQWIKDEVPDLIFGSLYNIYDGRTTVDCHEFYCAQALVLRSDRIGEILYCLANYAAIPDVQREGWPDILLSRIVGRVLHSPIHIHPTSLVQHIGEVSAWKE